ncbi:MAG: HD domain-containing protein [Clostridiales bacterium]|nr:HD domain-containing protein [Candidatus Blautia equi]
MERVNRILNHPIYQKEFRELQEAERERIFCNHTMEHFLDVARLMYIYSLEDGAPLSKELLYAAALLHDIGRNEQYQKGTPHEISGARLAGEILADCDFGEDEIDLIRFAIGNHRGSKGTGAEAAGDDRRELLSAYLYRADKRSRNCFSCKAEKECNWAAEKKNLTVQY